MTENLEHGVEASYRLLAVSVADGDQVGEREIRELCSLTGRTLPQFQADVATLEKRRKAHQALTEAASMDGAIQQAEAQQQAAQAALVAAQKKAAALVAKVVPAAQEANDLLQSLTREQKAIRAEALPILKATRDTSAEARLVGLLQQKSKLLDNLAASECGERIATTGARLTATRKALDKLESSPVPDAAAIFYAKEAVGNVESSLRSLEQTAEWVTRQRAALPTMDAQIAALESQRLNPEAITWSKGSMGEVEPSAVELETAIM